MSPGPFQPPFVKDEAAYRAKLRELEDEAKALGRTLTHHELTNMFSTASEYAYSTEFSVICTAAIRGDWEPAKERCRKERADKGEQVARELMRRYQRAVKERKKVLGML